MGNRATITLSADTKDRGVYVHWNGGRGSVAALVEETHKRMGINRKTIGGDFSDGEVDEDTITAFYATLYGAAREIFGYLGRYKERDPSSIYMASQDVRGGPGDNGCYVIENDFTCSRIDTSKFNQEEKNNYNSFAQFFDLGHHALCAVVDAETDHYKDPDFTIEELEQQLEDIEEIEKNAANRAKRMKAKLAAKKMAEEEEA
ncbi:MAG: hypothetical protein ACTIJH_06375 [Moraxellaceae bacterium]